MDIYKDKISIDLVEDEAPTRLLLQSYLESFPQWAKTQEVMGGLLPGDDVESHCYDTKSKRSNKIHASPSIITQ